MSTASVEQRSLDLLKAAHLMLKHGISPEGELQAALSSRDANNPTQAPGDQKNDQQRQDDDVVRLGEAITELGKIEFDIQKLEDKLRWRRETAQALAIEITQLRHRLGLSIPLTHEHQEACPACSNLNLTDKPCMHGRLA